MLTIGERIKFLRKQLGMTQDELAEITGIHPVSIRKYETNKMKPQIEQIEKIADALGINLGVFNGRDDMMSPIKTKGDLYSLLIYLYKAEVLTLVSERGEEGYCKPHLRFKLNPLFNKFFSVKAEKEKAITMDDLSFIIEKPEIDFMMCKWEKEYTSYKAALKEYMVSNDEDAQKTLTEKQRELELLEMSMQSNIEPVDI